MKNHIAIFFQIFSTKVPKLSEQTSSKMGEVGGRDSQPRIEKNEQGKKRTDSNE